MRDADRFKDKIDVSLDSRQLFFLFFGGAVVACMVFVLGVMVGKRLEGRERVARRATTSAMVDPLAALDQLGADEQASDLTFPSALSGESGAGVAPVVPAAQPKLQAKPDAKPDVKPDAKPDVKPDAKADVKLDAKADVKPDAKADVKPEQEPKPEVKPPTKAEAKAAREKEKDRKAGIKYTLQLSSFQDRGEADAFVTNLKAAGYSPYIVQRDVDDRGTFYRVRVGEYESHEDALAAKSDFEKRQHIIAYVTKL